MRLGGLVKAGLKSNAGSLLIDMRCGLDRPAEFRDPVTSVFEGILARELASEVMPG